MADPTLTLEQAQAELARSREEIAHLAAKLQLYGDGAPGSFSRSYLRVPREVVAGLEPLLLVDREARIADVNPRMCALLFSHQARTPPPHELRGLPLAAVDTLPWAPRILTTLLEDARRLGFPAEFTARRVDPSGETGRFVFHAEAGERGGHFLVEDVTMSARIEEYFSRYVGADVLALLKKQPEADFFRTTRGTLSVVFADLRGFTRASATLPPEEVCLFINEFLEAMIEVVDAHHACVDKIVGDEVMVLCGAPVPREDHAAQALAVAVGMLEAQAELSARWKSGTVEPLHALAVGIGIHSGEMVVGNIGSRRRSDYTVLGANVNLAARLCSHAPGGQILMSRTTFDAVREILRTNPTYFDPPLEGFREHDSITAKGFAEPIPVVAYGRTPAS